MLLEELKSQLSKGNEIENVLGKFDWKSFEKIVSDIFKENEFSTRLNFRFKTKRRYEVDVVAIRGDKLICIGCKWWGTGRYKKSALANAIKMQKSRTNELKKFLRRNKIAEGLLKLKSKFTVYSLIVTLHNEDMIKFSDTFVVPVWKLNSFLNDSENYI